MMCELESTTDLYYTFTRSSNSDLLLNFSNSDLPYNTASSSFPTCSKMGVKVAEENVRFYGEKRAKIKNKPKILELYAVFACIIGEYMTNSKFLTKKDLSWHE